MTLFTDLLQLYIMYKLIKFGFRLLRHRKEFGKNRRGKSIADKIIMICASGIHSRLDARIKAQRLAAIKPQAIPNNVVAFKKRKA